MHNGTVRSILAKAGVVAVALVTVGAATTAAAANSADDTGVTGVTSVGKPQPKHGGTVRIAQRPNDSPNVIWPFMDVNQVTSINIGEFQQFFFRPLYFAGRDDRIAIDDDLSPAQAPVWSEDGRTVTIRLKNWKWSNGERLTGRDVQFWINMAKAEKEHDGYYTPPMTIAGTTTNYFPDNVVSTSVAEHGISITFDQAYNRTWVLQNVLTTITPMPRAWDVTGPDGARGRCSADAVDTPTLKADCDPVFRHLSAASVDKKTFATNPLWQISDGPWKLKSYDAASGAYAIVRNKAYSGVHKPYLDEVDFVPYKNAEAQYADLQAGASSPNALQIGILPKAHAARYDPADLQAGNPLAGQGYHIAPRTYLDSISYYQLNFRSSRHGKLFRQAYFTKALQDSYDQQGVIDGPRKGWGHPTIGAVPALPEGNPLSPNAQQHRMKFDLAEARSLMAANGWDLSTTPAVCRNPGTGPGQCGADIAAGDKAEFDLDYQAGNADLPGIMAAYRTNLAQSGISVNLAEVPVDHLQSEASLCTPANPAGCAWDAALYGGWVYSPQLYPTGDSLFATGAAANVWGYSDPHLDQLIAKTITSNDIQDMYAYEDYVNDHQPVIYTDDIVAIYEVADGLRMPVQDPFEGYQPEFWYYTK
ncbi:peptide/nickel transport system substrate-binding protein [Streptomyces sp. 1114.5]|uniref:ABC transporter substrate-binding protein n=1 Tax=Streptomyces sp. 1114.5 TaxID=1938830 RepID=UPI000F1D1113|nr:ABC transporter substrate-binding protein [Streptomyces sp. 1114.5]RKT12187.1 peptide/nickel transport system substrate-binding protein [Streptomyces sp. 1114.5]